MKFCSKCKLEKDNAQFSPSKTVKSGFKSWCKSCESEARREHYHLNRTRLLAEKKQWQQENKQLYLQIKRRTRLKTTYGISPEDYEELLKAQNNKCAICNKDQSEFTQRLAVDHCHKTGRVRGILCFHCNQAIGKFQDNPELLREAINYLEK